VSMQIGLRSAQEDIARARQEVMLMAESS
jgi:hypothetical protein